MKLQMVNVTRKFGNFRAVENLNLTIENGVYGLLGVNGAGKTTLMRMICTLLPPTSGQILCDGKDIFKMDGEYRNLLGYLPQEFGFYPDFTVKDYLLYIASLKGMYNAKFSSADEVYASIYRQAKVSIYVVDNYIGLRTLVHLKNSQSGVSIILFSDNVGNNKLHNIEFTDFCKEYPNVKISMQKTGEIFHDRFIVLDYGTADERVFLCGASSKDAGARITSIVEDYGTKKYASVMATLLQNPPLVLPK